MSYRKIGDLIQLVDVRNKDLSITHLVGLTINKKFIPSVANTIGTDMSNYKIIRKNQFACSTMQVRRDKKMPVALLKELDVAIISQAYPVFEVIDEKELLPEYLMLWFTRSEFDREACFNAVGGVRGSLEWEDFCNMELPVPSIEKQREIVAQYQAIENKIKVNEQICEKLEATAQTLYKQWFVDFEFPNEEGQPYKSSGGKMVWNEELEKEIPEGWEVVNVVNLYDYTYGYAFNSDLFNEQKEGFPLIRIRDIINGYSDIYTKEDCQDKYFINENDLLIGMDGKFHIRIWNNDLGVLNQRIIRFRNININTLFLYFSIKDEIEYLENNIYGTTVAHLSDKNINNIKKQNQKLSQLQSLLLSRLATLEG
ncbi:restriction endonuclease subunit S [Faecalibacter sp. LW9]|uniref:restriction endonuclease subunit S n=1 Tax=Faecalibacter sp. LW9 TaxID=3103144 RepID=UPI002AFE3095|nr:restriction endonuclease subunit S [Faecalibacter sp. LW9]